ncbi:MAG: Yip1 protein [Dehalococcoidia bacterium]|nr:Yip1 protein [Dehalococcoidia bacterium]
MIRASILDSKLYEEVENDSNLTSQALQVVLAVSVLSGIGSAVAQLSFGRFISGVVGAIAAWLLWSLVSYLIGTYFFGGKATFGQLLRTLGYAQSPAALKILLAFGVIPFFGGFIYIPVKVLVSIWLLATFVVAIRQALDVTTIAAVLTALVSWPLVLLVSFMLVDLL